MTQIAIVPQSEMLVVLQRSLYPGASDESVGLVLSYCKAAGLDPMQKPVQIVPMWDSKAKQTRDVIMPGIGLYRTQAARTGQYGGMSEPAFGPTVKTKLDGREFEHPEWCKVTVTRLLSGGVSAQFTACEYWLENYAPKGGADKSKWPNAMWERRKFGQLAKCCEAQALRKAFPEVGAAPTDDEYQHDAEPPPMVERLDSVVQLPDYTDEALEKNSAAWADTIKAGKKTAQDVINILLTRFTLTKDQKQRIEKLGKPSPFEKYKAEIEACNSDEYSTILAEASGFLTEDEFTKLEEMTK